jgi:hypothetical protein
LTAIANAKQKDVNPSDLVFKEIQINEGPRLKRYRAGARGRAKPYKKRMSHIRIVLVVKEKEAVAGKEEVSKKETKREKLVEAKKANRKQEAEKKV